MAEEVSIVIKNMSQPVNESRTSLCARTCDGQKVEFVITATDCSVDYWRRLLSNVHIFYQRQFFCNAEDTLLCMLFGMV